MKSYLNKLIVFSFILFFLIPVLVQPLNINIQAELPDWVQIERGADYEIYQNSKNLNEFRWLSAPLWIFDGSEYVPYIFTNKYVTHGYVTVQTALIGAEFHKGKVVYYDPSLTDLAVGRENFIVLKWLNNKWEPVCASLEKYFKSASFNKQDDYIEVIAEWETNAGTLKIIYHFEERLKHTVIFTPNSAGKYAVQQLWVDIQYEKVKLGNKTIIHRSKDHVIGKSDSLTFLFFSDIQPFGIFENQHGEDKFKFAIFAKGTVTYQGHEITNAVAYCFGAWILNFGESLEIDPTTTTFYAASNDAYTWSSRASYTDAHDQASANATEATLNYLYVGQYYWNNEAYIIYRGFLLFDTSALPDGAVISSAVLGLYGYQDMSSVDFLIVIRNGQPDYPHDPVVDGDHLYSHYSGDGGSFNTTNWTIDSYNDITLNADGRSWISKTGTTKLALISQEDIDSSAPAGQEFIAFDSYESESGSNKAKLTITYQTTPANEGVVYGEDLVGYWRFDEGSGTDAYDDTGYSNDGTLNGDPQWVSKGFNYALEFDGSGDYVAYPQLYDVNELTELSVEVWFRPAEIQNDHKIVYHGTGGEWCFIMYTDGIKWAVKIESGFKLTDMISYEADKWYYALGTWKKGDKLTFTLNATYITLDVPDEYMSGSGSPSIGCYSRCSDYFNGTIDEVRVYSKVLSNATRDLHFYSSLNAYGLTLSKKQYYPFQVQVSDASGIADLDYVEIRFETASGVYNARARWTQSSNAFSITQGSEYIEESGSTKEEDGNQVILTFKIRFDWDYPLCDQNVSIQIYSLTDSAGSDTDVFADIFYIENDLVFSGLAVDDYDVTPGQTLTFSGNVYYEGLVSAQIYPPDGDYQVKIKLSGVQKGSTDTTLVSGAFSISDVTAEGAGEWSYTVECSYMVSAGSFSTVTSYANINLHVLEWDLATELNGAVLTMNNGTDHDITITAGWANYTGIYTDPITIKVKYQNVWVNGTFSLTVGNGGNTDVQCKVWQITLNAKDSDATILTLSNTTFYWTFSNGTTVNEEVTAGTWSFKTVNGTSYYRIKYQDVWVTGNVTLTDLGPSTGTVNKNCEVYSLTVHVRSTSDSDPPNADLSGASLTLQRGGTVINGLYGLPSNPVTNGTGYYVWTQLANQTSSYKIIADITGCGGPQFESTALTSDTTVTISLVYPVGGEPPGGPTPTGFNIGFLIYNQFNEPFGDVNINIFDKSTNQSVVTGKTDVDGKYMVKLEGGEYVVKFKYEDTVDEMDIVVAEDYVYDVILEYQPYLPPQWIPYLIFGTVGALIAVPSLWYRSERKKSRSQRIGKRKKRRKEVKKSVGKRKEISDKEKKKGWRKTL